MKAVATRGDGKVVMGVIGLASVAGNAGGQSEIILAASRLLFVPIDSPNATPVQALEVGLVDGVTTLRIPAARIGDLTVDTLKLANNAVTVATSASLSTNFQQTSNYPPEQFLAVGINTGGAPILVLGEVWYYINLADNEFFFEVTVNGAVVKTYNFLLENATSGSLSIAHHITSPGTGTVSVGLKCAVQHRNIWGVPTTLTILNSKTFLYCLGAKK